ncbi:MAG: B12-binding domain-containing radical SAM protein [Planctomycetes bacterium]|nr:B12-binding domain-containing radical SAM protein [Planctomycetota bacterium]
MRVVFLQKFLPQEMLGIAWLSRALKDAGHEAQVQFLPDPEWESRLKASNPGLVAFSVTTGDHRFYLKVAERAKELTGAPTIWGGPHATFVPDVVLENGVDFICRGEGEQAVPELATRLERGDDPYTVANLSFARDGVRVDNVLRPLAANLDALGLPDREPIYAAGQIYRDCDRKIFLTQRGCLYNCSFCFHHAWRDKLYHAKPKEYLRKRSVAHVIQEIDDVRSRYPLKFIHFLDDIFNVDEQWLDEFCEVYPKAVGLPFDVILRTNLTKPEHMTQLKRAGCISARLAFEAASDHVRNKIYRKGTSLDDLKNSSRYIKNQGIRLTTLNLLGAPGATLEDELATLQLNVDCKVDHPLCSLLQPYPETDINDITRDMGFAVDEFDAFPEKFNRTTSIAFERRHEIENLHKLFPIIVRFPSLMPLVRPAIKARMLSKLYLAMYLLWTEYLVCEQNQTVAQATKTATLGTFPPFDLLRRVSSKTTLKVREAVFGRRFSKQRLALQMEEDTIAHAGG